MNIWSDCCAMERMVLFHEWILNILRLDLFLPSFVWITPLVQFRDLIGKSVFKWAWWSYPNLECFRYIAVCRPHQYRAISLTMTNTRRLLVYIVPVTVLSFALNVPKFMEVTVTEHNGTNEVDASQTRKDPTFIFWWDQQRLSMSWIFSLQTVSIFVTKETFTDNIADL